MDTSVQATADSRCHVLSIPGFRSTLVFEKIAGKDIEGALEKLENCTDVLEQYPGLCRFTMG